MPPRIRRFGWIRVVLLAYLSVLAVFSLVGDRGLWKSYRLWTECTRVEDRNATLSREIDTLRTEVRLYRTDLRTIEKFARENLHLAGDNEIHYIFR